MKYWEILKNKWGIESDRRMIWIFIIFAITGSSIVFVRKPIQIWLFNEEHFWSLDWYKMIVITLLVYVVYQIHLIVIGTVLGEHSFFKQFLLKMNKRLIPSKK
ncbi:MAG: hypothetical protein RLZZ337_701 [Bacteroidota bacterium]|jgi:hypothetical protein